MYAAVLDTCVLYPSLQRDFLLSLAAEGSYRPLWSTKILQELRECEQEKLTERAGFTASRAEKAVDHLLDALRASFDDAEVDDWRRYISTIELPDPDDRHVVACAIAGRADAIVTSNLRDFPPSQIPTSIEITPPAVFALNNVTLDPARARRAIEGIVERSGSKNRPKRTFDGVLTVLESRYAMTEAVQHLRS